MVDAFNHELRRRIAIAESNGSGAHAAPMLGVRDVLVLCELTPVVCGQGVHTHIEKGLSMAIMACETSSAVLKGTCDINE